MRSRAPAPSHCMRDYPSIAGCPCSFPPTKQKHEGQLAKASLLFLKAQPVFARWRRPRPMGSLPPLAPLLRGFCTLEKYAQRPWGYRGPSALSEWGSASCLPWGISTDRAHLLWVFWRQLIGTGASRCPGPPSSQAHCRCLGPSHRWSTAGVSPEHRGRALMFFTV